MFRNIVSFYGEKLPAPCPTPEDGGPRLAGCPRLLIQYIRSYPPYLEAVPPSTWESAMLWLQWPTYHGFTWKWLRKSIKLRADFWNTDPLNTNRNVPTRPEHLVLYISATSSLHLMKPERSHDGVWQLDDVSEFSILRKLDVMVGGFELKLNMPTNFQCRP
jgi:hypothetical protein